MTLILPIIFVTVATAAIMSWVSVFAMVIPPIVTRKRTPPPAVAAPPGVFLFTDHERGQLPPQPFTAWCDCPRCGHIACHGLREPVLADPDAIAEWEENHIDHYGWGGYLWSMPPKPRDESGFEVIRICKCGNEWGQL